MSLRGKSTKSIRPANSDYVWNLPDNTCLSFVECIDTPEPTIAPTEGEYEDTPQPTPAPTTPAPYIKGGNTIELIMRKRDLIETQVLVSNRFGVPTPSKRYKFDRLVRALQLLAIDGFGAPIKVSSGISTNCNGCHEVDFVLPFKFNLWHDNLDMYVYGLVNLAAFLANAMVESIDQDTCSEINWQDTQGRYALSNACGQESRSYQDEICQDRGKEDIFSCPVLEDMEINSDDVAQGERVAPPLKCKPGEGLEDQSGYWDSDSNVLNDKTAYSNDLGRTDLQGCCWWGRGALKTRGEKDLQQPCGTLFRSVLLNHFSPMNNPLQAFAILASLTITLEKGEWTWACRLCTISTFANIRRPHAHPKQAKNSPGQVSVT